LAEFLQDSPSSSAETNNSNKPSNSKEFHHQINSSPTSTASNQLKRQTEDHPQLIIKKIPTNKIEMKNQ
jgi:hypothetical protein